MYDKAKNYVKENGLRKVFSYFTVRDLILIAAMAALGVALKPVINPIVHLITTPLQIPGGSLAGGLYMMWIVVAMGLTGKRLTPTMVGLVQAILVMITGITGSHGAMSLISYTLPGIVVDLALLIMNHRVCCLPCSFVAGMLANVTGTACTNMIFFNLPLIPLILSLLIAAFSGAIGGIISWGLLKSLKKFGIGQDAGAVSDTDGWQDEEIASDTDGWQDEDGHQDEEKEDDYEK